VVNAVTAEVDLAAGNFTGLTTNQALTSVWRRIGNMRRSESLGPYGMFTACVLLLCQAGSTASKTQEKTTPDTKLTAATSPIYTQVFSGCFEPSCIRTDTFRIGSLPNANCMLQVQNGDGRGTDEARSYEVFFNEDRVIAAHRSGNAQAHVKVLSNNAVKVVLTGEVFRRLFIEIVCDAKVAQSQASQPGAEGSKAAGQPVRVVICTDHAKYGLRDSMKLSASLQNTTDEPVYVDRRMFWTGYGGGLKLEIRDERGEPLPARVLSDAIMPPPVEGDTSILIRLDEGFSYGTWVNLSVKDFFPKPGRYSIRVIYKSWLRREFVAPQLRDLPAIWADTSDIPSDQMWVDVVQ
jgi:hypothetical protein